MYGKIDDILKKKYDEIVIPPDIFDFDKIFKKYNELYKNKRINKKRKN